MKKKILSATKFLQLWHLMWNVDSDDDGAAYVQDGDKLGTPESVVNLNAEICDEQTQACNT